MEYRLFCFNLTALVVLLMILTCFFFFFVLPPFVVVACVQVKAGTRVPQGNCKITGSLGKTKPCCCGLVTLPLGMSPQGPVDLTILVSEMELTLVVEWRATPQPF